MVTIYGRPFAALLLPTFKRKKHFIILLITFWAIKRKLNVEW